MERKKEIWKLLSCLIFLILWGLLILTACGKNTFRIQEETCSANEISEDSSEPTSQTNINVVDSKITSEAAMGSEVVADTENQPAGNQWTSNQSTGKQPASGEANSGQEADLEVEPATCFVYVCGAVMSPGVYELDSDARVQDALNAAQGFREDACPDYINLASHIVDGEKIYFPSQEEVDAGSLPEDVSQLSATGTGGDGTTGITGSSEDGSISAEEAKASALININTASVEELCDLPGIGESRAKDIVAYRTEHGNFKSKEDLMQVSGIKEGLYNKLKDLITI